MKSSDNTLVSATTDTTATDTAATTTTATATDTATTATAAATNTAAIQSGMTCLESAPRAAITLERRRELPPRQQSRQVLHPFCPLFFSSRRRLPCCRRAHLHVIGRVQKTM